jgi:hypothetical protein
MRLGKLRNTKFRILNELQHKFRALTLPRTLARSLHLPAHRPLDSCLLRRALGGFRQQRSSCELLAPLSSSMRRYSFI